MKTNTKSFWCLGLAFLAVLASPVGAEGVTVGAHLEPYVSLPLGESAADLTPGAGAAFSVSNYFREFPWSLGLEADYTWSQTVLDPTPVSVVGVGPSVRLSWPLFPHFSVAADGAGGWYYGWMTDTSGTVAQQGGWFQGGLGLEWAIDGPWVLALQVDGRKRINLEDDLRLTLQLQVRPFPVAAPGPSYPLAPGFRLLSDQRKGLQLSGYRADRLYPVLAKSYDAHPPLQVVLHNYEKTAAEQITLVLDGGPLTSGPRTVKVPTRLGPNLELTVDLTPVFNEKIWTVVKADRLPLTLTLQYLQNGKPAKDLYRPEVTLEGRNAINGDLTKLPAFVSPRDPTATLAKAAAASFKPSGPTPDLQTAVAIHTALRLAGVTNGSSLGGGQVRFPIETYSAKGGDSRDLAVLTAAMLEAVGLETAFLEANGKVYPAFALTSGGSLALWGASDLVTVQGAKTWVPLDPTAPTFLEGWKTAAAAVRGQPASSLASVREAWKTTPAALLPGSAAVPVPATLAAGVKAAQSDFVVAGLKPLADPIQAELKTASKTQAPVLQNRLGILFAQFGLYTDAVDQLKKAAAAGLAPAQVNLGFAQVLGGQPKGALETFQAALKRDPANVEALAGLALAYRSAGDPAMRKAATDRLAKADRDRAAALLTLKVLPTSDAGRAADIANVAALVRWAQ